MSEIIKQINVDGVDYDIVSESAEKKIAELEKNNTALNDKIDTKAPKSGYAPDLKVNFAKELVGRGEATPEVIGSIRPTGVRSIGDGNATIERIKGESVVWNQLEPNYDLSNNALSAACKNTTTINGIVSIEGVNSYTAYIYASRDNIKIYQGHKYLLSVEVRSAEYVPNQMAVYDLTNKKTLIVAVQTRPGSNKWEKISNITTATTNGIGSFLIYPVYNSAIFDTLTDWQGRNFIVQDLTLMFGAGNEPTTIEEFETRKPLNVSNEYNEGTIVSYNGDALKSVGFNAYNGTYAKVIGGEEYHATGTTSVSFAKELDGDATPITLDDKGKFIPEEDGYVFAEGKNIVIHLTHSYTPDHVDEYEEDVHPLPNVKSILDAEGNQLFPYGLLSAGSVHDEITATKAIKRVGVVDMGTFNWWTNASFNCWVIEMPNDYKHGTLSAGNCVNQKFPVENYAIFANSSTEKVLSGNNKQALFVRDSSYTTAADFKAAMSGVLLYYELAEPIEVDLLEELNMTYEAWDFGTEELIADSATTPLNAEIVYQFNAVDRIRENSSAIDVLEEHVEERKNDDIELLANGNLKLTLKGETMEFMPATPSGDPMHWAYVSAGAEYNATDEVIKKTAFWGAEVDHLPHHYYLNGLGDITAEEMAVIYKYKECMSIFLSSTDAGRSRFFQDGGFVPRTLFAAFKGLRVAEVTSINSSFAANPFTNCPKLKVIRWIDSSKSLSTYGYAAIKTDYGLFYNCPSLEVIDAITPNKDVYGGQCVNLIECRLTNLDYNVTLSTNRKISKESVLYMIQNVLKSTTKALVITLHADIYAKCIEGGEWYEEVQSALDTANAAITGGGSINIASA